MIGGIVWIALAIVSADGHPLRGSVVAAVMSWQAAGVPAARQGAVEREVSAIWRRLGIDVQWRDARARELGVTIVVKDTATNPGPLPPLGWVNFVGNEPTAVLYASASAAWDSVQAGRTEAGRFMDQPLELQEALAARLLGRAVAHELGHYLLGSRAHTTRGLMRPTLHVVEALTRGPDGYDLDRTQRATLQQRLALLFVRARAGEAGAAGSHS